MHYAFNLEAFHNSMFTPFFIFKGYVRSGEIALKNNTYYYYYYFLQHNILTLYAFVSDVSKVLLISKNFA